MIADQRRHLWLLELLASWRHFNRIYTGNALREPLLRIADGATRLGTWDANTRTIAIAQTHILDAPWLAVLQTLRHEMAHQYVDEVLHAGDEPAHGPAFEHASALLRAHGPELDTPTTGEARRLTERVHKLLALGQSPNANEAEAALAKARELMLRHQIPGNAAPGSPTYRVRWFGALKARHPLWEQLLAGILGEFFGVSVLWNQSYDARRCAQGSVLEVIGTPDQLALAEYVHVFLTRVLAELWSAYKTAHHVHGDRERQRYYAGALRGFAQTLRRQDARLRAAHALVWQGDAALDAHVRYLHPRTRRSAMQAPAQTHAYRTGVEDGKSVRLRQPLADRAEGVRGYLRG